MPEQKNINTIFKAADILKCLTRGINQSSSIADHLKQSRSTTHRMLKTLQRAEFVIQDPITMRYSLGPFVHFLSEASNCYHHELIFSALPEMENLRNITGETIVLAVRVGLRRMYVEELDSFQPLKFAPGKGYAAPLHAGATGKVLLAQTPHPERKRLLEAIKLDKVNENTITDRATLTEEIEEIRRQGYAVSCSELVDGAASVAAPIDNYSQPVAICVLGPESRMVDRFDEILGFLRKTVAGIEKALAKEIS